MSLLVGCLLCSACPSIAQEWTPLPWVSPEIMASGVQIGGEGAQVLQALDVDRVDGRFLVYGTDVGGLFRSLDGGKTWEPCNVGFTPRGACGVAIDPRNAARVLVVGANSLAHEAHGLSLSTDQAGSWKQVFPARIVGYRDYREQLAFDPSSFDPAVGYCTDVYWSRVATEYSNSGEPDIDPAIYKSSDGGQTWHKLPAGEGLGGSHVAVHPTQRGVLYLAGPKGLHRSKDAGATFERLREEPMTGVAVSPADPDAVWLSAATHAEHSSDRGATWERLSVEGLEASGNSRDDTEGFPGVARTGVSYEQISVSAAQPMHIAMRSKADHYRQRIHVSHDGGQTWQAGHFDNTLAFLPHNNREYIIRWHPTDPQRAWSFGGDWLTHSGDAGRTFGWSGDGGNSVLVGGAFHFNPHHAGLMLCSSQDYNGAVTQDNARTWTYTNPSGNRWGGFTYGGYALSPRRLFTGNAQGWGSPRILRTSTDGGQTWHEVPQVAWFKDGSDRSRRGIDTSMGHPANPEVVFVAGFRSPDAGETWARMAGCMGVLTSMTEAPYALFGADVSEQGMGIVVRSDDQGVTWKQVAQVEGAVEDLAYDPARDALWVAHGGALSRLQANQIITVATPRDDRDNRYISSVAIDPADPQVVYAAQRMNVYRTSASALRSTDGGQTWAVLNVNTPLDGSVKDGGREAIWVRVDPATRDAWFSTGCYGMWKVSAPHPGDWAEPRSWGQAQTSPLDLGDEPGNLLRNGRFTHGSPEPVGWRINWVGSGAVALSVDTESYIDAPSAMRVASDDPATKAVVLQEVRPSQGKAILAGHLMTQGSVKASVGIKFWSHDWKVLSEVQVFFAQNQSPWQQFEKQIDVPAGVMHADVQLYIEGAGSALLDAITMTPVQ